MTFSAGKFNFEKNKLIPVDKFIERALYEPNKGYYTKKIPFGSKGDFVTAPTISNLFSEIISIWIVSAWEKLGKPKKFNFVELGPGDGSLAEHEDRPRGGVPNSPVGVTHPVEARTACSAPPTGP